MVTSKTLVTIFIFITIRVSLDLYYYKDIL
ncbi:hypothetical protein FLCU109888_06430 [Flavobacterium cucumis]|uniref:Uncharacterized protein n=1 Tax=Flavobacterium cucumis TaxID=416016 RepID=A0A1M7ZXB0_9FLAO|nr:hypothetical protein SAMN05443547_1880 [Flavobacterium cucumis]